MRRHIVLKAASIAGALAVAFVAGKDSLAFALADAQPQLALRLNSGQSEALSAAAHSAISGSSPDLRLAERQAIEALRVDPTSSGAAAALAVAFQLDGPSTDAMEAMRYVQKLSRRNLAGQLWWIEYWANQGDVERTLGHYDTAMRTSRAAPSLLFPVLVQAIENPIVSRRLVAILARRPLWAEQFVQQLAQSGQDLDAIYDLLHAMALAGAPAADQALQTTLNRLVDDGRHSQAFLLFAAYRPDHAMEPVRNPQFRSSLRGQTIFDWQLADDRGSAALSPEGLLISAPSGNTKPVVSQVVALPAGQHLFDLVYSPSNAAGAAELGLLVHCLGNEDLLGRSESISQGRAQLQFSVPANCPLQRLEVAWPESDPSLAASVLVTSIRKLR